VLLGYSQQIEDLYLEFRDRVVETFHLFVVLEQDVSPQIGEKIYDSGCCRVLAPSLLRIER
jgi:hypothetical protein